MLLPRSVRIWVSAEAVDMRRGHDGLTSVVKNVWGLDPFSGHLFVFLGKRRDRCKIVFFDRGGFVLYYKRLEKGRFVLPRLIEGERTATIDATDLAMLLDGIDLSRVRKPALWEPRAVGVAQKIDKRAEL
jgi:transposase